MAIARIMVRVTAGASRNELLGFRQGAWRVKIAAPPLEGRANAALEDFLAECLKVRRSQVRVASGPRSRLKTLEIEGLTSEEAAARLTAPGRQSGR